MGHATTQNLPRLNLAPPAKFEERRYMVDYIEMTTTSLSSSLIGVIAGSLGTYVTFYIRGALARREQIARSLAEFYSSAATNYYAARDYQGASKAGEDGLTLYKLFDQHYKEFLSASTMLASLVPPELREEVLSIEDLWDEINEGGFAAVPGKVWFDALDGLRYKILDSIRYNRLTDPYWKF
jgi:hypothetical protein